MKKIRKGSQEKRDLWSRFGKGVPATWALAVPLVPVGVPISLGCQTRDKRTPRLSQSGGPSWETGTTRDFPTGTNQVLWSSEGDPKASRPPLATPHCQLPCPLDHHHPSQQKRQSAGRAGRIQFLLLCIVYSIDWILWRSSFF